ncbi:hypothetical protein ACWEOE_25750 [Amycolatopsis sp. NPDC004368]
MTTPVQDTAAAVRKLGVSPDTYGSSLDTATDPAATEVVGAALADLLTTPEVDRVAVWHGADDAVLAHVVARQLGATVTRASELEGVVGFHPPVAAGERIALVATAWEPARLRTLLNLATTTQAEVVAVAAVLATPALAETTDTVALLTELPGGPR